MKLQDAERIINKHYRLGLDAVKANKDLREEQKSDQIRFIKHKLGHMHRCVRVASYFIRRDRKIPDAEHERFLSGVLLHDIGNFYEMDKERIVSGKNHAVYGRQLLIEKEDFSVDNPDHRLILDMTEQHSTMTPKYSDDDAITYGIHLIRNADNIENIEFLTSDILDESRSLYFYKNMPDGPINDKVRDAFNARSLVDFRDAVTRSDLLIAYAAWKNNLTLSIAHSLWDAKKYTERLTETAFCLAEGKEIPKSMRKQAPQILAPCCP